ncbi:putative membrane protein YdfJ with MMPL/SSD domain [Kitasatospora sp. GP82]|nr:putative membrane protein YdfJ with MMPL/SSD domain [Kitasatospora sp. GP82]
MVHVRDGSVRDTAVRQKVTSMLDQVAKLPSVASVTSMYGPTGAPQISRDGRTAYATVTFDAPADRIPATDVTRVVDTAQAARDAQLGAPSDVPALNTLVQAVRSTPGVASVVAEPVTTGTGLSVIDVVPVSAPQDEATGTLVTHLRKDVVPVAERGSSLRVHVGGATAASGDLGGVLAGKLPLFLGVIVGLGCLLLMVAFRSILVPLTAAVMNLLASAASFGVVVAVFQWGWGSEALGLGKAGPVEAALPAIMLAILFGLSMDYQVFLVSRMHDLGWLADLLTLPRQVRSANARLAPQDVAPGADAAVGPALNESVR